MLNERIFNALEMHDEGRIKRTRLQKMHRKKCSIVYTSYAERCLLFAARLLKSSYHNFIMCMLERDDKKERRWRTALENSKWKDSCLEMVR